MIIATLCNYKSHFKKGSETCLIDLILYHLNAVNDFTMSLSMYVNNNDFTMSLMLTKIHQVILPLPHQQPIPGPTFHPHCPAKSKQQIKYMNSIKIPFSTSNL